jgi:hypothetical protein
VLDIGQSLSEEPHFYPGDVTSCMAMLVSGLPNLTHLDISGTNLASRLESQYKRYAVILCFVLLLPYCDL